MKIDYEVQAGKRVPDGPFSTKSVSWVYIVTFNSRTRLKSCHEYTTPDAAYRAADRFIAKINAPDNQRSKAESDSADGCEDVDA